MSNTRIAGKAGILGGLGICIAVGVHILPDYLIAQLALVCIYALAGLGMVVVVGLSGQISLGHAAFLALGAYAAAILQALDVPFLVALPLAGAVAGVIGGLVGVLFARLSGPYFAMATIAFASLVKEAIVRWEQLTNGNLGIYLQDLSIFSVSIADDRRFFYLALAVLVLAMTVVAGLWSSPAGRAIGAVRDDEVAAKSAGIEPKYYRSAAFGISAALVGLAGALYAHKILYISPEAFGFGASLELLVIAAVGGLAAISGAIWGAFFVIVLPQAIAALGGYLPFLLEERASVQGFAYGAALVAVMLREPQGLHGLLIGVGRRLSGVLAARKAIG